MVNFRHEFISYEQMIHDQMPVKMKGIYLEGFKNQLQYHKLLNFEEIRDLLHSNYSSALSSRYYY